MATGFYLVFFFVGGLIAPIVSAAIMGSVGWRGVASLGFLALIIGILVWGYAPESVRWLAAKGRIAETQAEVARHLSLPLTRVPSPPSEPLAQPRGNLLDLLSQPRMFVETILIWGSSSIAMYGYTFGAEPSLPYFSKYQYHAQSRFLFLSPLGLFIHARAVTLVRVERARHAASAAEV
jgi:MFS family permease